MEFSLTKGKGAKRHSKKDLLALPMEGKGEKASEYRKDVDKC